MSKTKSRRGRGARGATRKKGGLMLGMRSGFKGMAHAVAGEQKQRASRSVAGLITIVFVIALLGWLMSRL